MTIGVIAIRRLRSERDRPADRPERRHYAVHGAVTADETIDFTGAGGTLEFDDTPDMKGTISGFARRRPIVLSDVAYRSRTAAPTSSPTTCSTSPRTASPTRCNSTRRRISPAISSICSPTRPAAPTSPRTPRPAIAAARASRPRAESKRVETLKIGDKVMTKSGAARPIKWIGRRSFAGRFIIGRKDILPVCIKAGALGGNAPRRDLWISPHHAMYFDGTYFTNGLARKAC